MEFCGWKSVPIWTNNPKWDSVRDCKFTQPSDLKTPKEVLRYVRENIKYVSDNGDHWQTPAETMILTTGDCEDFVILMRALLIRAGFDSSTLWMLIGNDLLARQQHAVLVIEDKFVLDHRNPKVLRLEQLTDFAPIVAYSDNKAITFGRKI